MSSSKLREITDLFAQLALNLKTLDPTANNQDQPQPLDLSVSILNNSLNLPTSSTSSSSVNVLNTVLSLMCFKAPRVYDTSIKYLVNTLVTVLSCSISCKPLKLHNIEYMRVGGEISKAGCAKLIESCTDIFPKLEEHGISYQSLLYALVKAAVSASDFSYGVGVVPILDTSSFEQVKKAVSKLFCCLPSDLLLTNEEIPLRLLFWYLDPMILKNNVSKILNNAINRPFICFETEFHENMEWRSILMCLAISPSMFVETRTLLHNWFLTTGSASVLELEIKLASMVLDFISRPMWWGLSMEFGLKLPSSRAYFAHNHYLLRTLLQGPIICENLQDIVHITDKMAHHTHALDHNSPWTIAMLFPNWFYLASSLLFRGKNIQDNAATYKHPSDLEPSYISDATRYITWILEPISESHQKLLIELLTKVSESWILKKCSDKNIKRQNSVSRKKLKKPKTHDSKDDCVLVQLWLKEFQDMYSRYLRKTYNSCSQGITSQQNVLLRRMTLGIVIGYSHELDENGSQLLLHYAATGKIWNSHEIESSSKYFVNYYNHNEAVAGIRLIFDLTDIVESISGSLFDTDDRGANFICSFKLRGRKYLLGCVKRLLEIEKGGDSCMLRDLYTRLEKWRLIGKDVLDRDFDDVIDALNFRLSSLCKD